MASTTSLTSSLANFILLSLLFSSASSLSTIEQSFQDCFTSSVNSPLNNSSLLHLPNTPSYNQYFTANLQNLRFLNATSRRPSFIVTPSVESDVASAVACTRNLTIDLRIRSGGHDYEGLSYLPSLNSTLNPFILIDLASLSYNTDFQIDLAQGTAWVGSGATIGQLCFKISEKGNTVAFPGGICPTIGIGGLFSGGGIGMLMRKYGVSADNIVDVKLIRPDGVLVDRSSMSEDHFWAVKGGGGSSFGIITRFKIRLVAVPPTVTIFDITKTLKDNATALVERWQHVAPALDEDVFIRILALAADDKEAKGNRTIKANFQCLFLGGKSELVAMLDEKFPELGITAEDCKEMSWIYSVHHFAGFTNESLSILMSRESEFKGWSFKAKSDFVREPIPASGWEEIWKFLMEGKDEPVAMIMDPWGGKLDEIAEDEIAFPHRKGNLYNIQYFMRWLKNDEGVSERHLDWMRKFYELMTPYVSKNPRAAYLNYKDLDLGWNDGGRANYSEAASEWGRRYFLNNFEKLATVKAKIDPENKFWNELTIPPLFAY